ncbi:M48 family metallopeptidase [bacterium]|nr:M48 family metallopeptidase [bacterium]
MKKLTGTQCAPLLMAYGSRQVKVQVFYQNRKYVNVTVWPDMQVMVKAPGQYEGSRQEELIIGIRKRMPWIVKQIDYFKRLPLPQSPRKYLNGETHYYLGRQYRLKSYPGKTSHVKLVGRFFNVSILSVRATGTLNTGVNEQMKQWYEEHAKKIILKKIDAYYSVLKKRLDSVPKVQFRWMQKRWGSCSPKGTITINYEVIKAPLSCIEYVVLHELCHLKYPQHDKRFYNFLTKYLPDWENRKKQLEEVVL